MARNQHSKHLIYEICCRLLFGCLAAPYHSLKTTQTCMNIAFDCIYAINVYIFYVIDDETAMVDYDFHRNKMSIFCVNKNRKAYELIVVHWILPHFYSKHFNISCINCQLFIHGAKDVLTTQPHT